MSYINKVDPYHSLSEQKKSELAVSAFEWFDNSLTESSTKSPFEQHLETLIAKGAQFTDLEFPPSVKSLTGEAHRSNWSAFVWRRPSEFLNGNVNLVEKGIQPEDIKQGVLGDCYFLSTLASMSEIPQRILDIFKLSYQEKSGDEVIKLCEKHGIYCLELLDMGVPKEIIIDDYVPCLSAVKGPAFTKTNGNEIWVTLLEKAWAKLYGSYNNIEAGITRECLHDLTKAPTKTIWSDQTKLLWSNILKGEKENWIMTTSSLDNPDSNDSANEFGIVFGHAYSLLAGYEVNFKGQTVKLVKLRNPWGGTEWKGKWSDKCSNWNYLSKDELAKFEESERRRNDGIFFMQFEDYTKHFENAQFCLYHEGYQYSYKTVKSTKKNGVFFRVFVPKRGKYFFSINLESKRKFPQEIQDDWNYPISTIVVGKLNEDNKYSYVEGKQDSDRELWTTFGEDTLLDEGEYIVYAKVQWILGEKGSFTFSVYGADKAQIYSHLDSNNEFLKGVYLDYAKNKSKNKKSLADVGAPRAYICVDQTDDGFAFLACWSEEANKKVKYNIRVKNMKENGMRIKGRGNKSDTADIVFDPKVSSKNEDIVLVRIKDYENCRGLSYTHQLSAE